MRIKKITMALTLTGTMLAGGALAAAPAGAATPAGATIGRPSVATVPACFAPDCSWGDHHGVAER